MLQRRKCRRATSANELVFLQEIAHYGHRCVQDVILLAELKTTKQCKLSGATMDISQRNPGPMSANSKLVQTSVRCFS